MFKKAREKALQILSEQKDKDDVPGLDGELEEEGAEESSATEDLVAEETGREVVPEEVPGEENSISEDAPVEETEVVPDENVENLEGSEVAVEGEETTPQSAEPTAPLTQGSQSGEDNVDIEALIAENAAQKEEIASLRKALEQSGQLAKESTVAVATGDFDDIDFSALVYGDNEAKKGAAGKLMEYVMGNLRGEAAPVLKEWDEAKRALDVQKAIKVLSSLEDEFPGFGKEADAIEALIGRDKVLASYENPMQSRIVAYLMNKGIKAAEKEKAGMSLDELMDIYRKNEEFKAAIEKERLQLLEETGDIPVIPMDGGGLSAAVPYEAPEGPKTLEEAHKLVKKIYKKG